MASPQKENGYTGIANEILESLVMTRLLGSEFQIVLCIIRKTYGFQKKEDRISLSQFQKDTKISRPTVVKTLKNLLSRSIINKINGLYSFNKDWEKWGSKGVLTSKGVFTTSGKGVLTKTGKGVLTHKRKKETITKEIVAEATTWNFEEELKKLKESPETRKDLKIIALYWKKKGWVFENKKQFSSSLKRELRPAKSLDGYTGLQIAEAIKYCEKEYKVWTLETVFKRIQDLINKK